MNTQKYWNDRFKAQAKKYYKQGDKSLVDLQKLFKGSSIKFEKEINSFYAKYGIVDKSPTYKTLADGTKVISGTTNKLIVTKRASDVKLAAGTRISKLEGKLQIILKDLANDQNNLMKNTLGSIANDAYYDTVFEVYKGYEIGTSFSVLNPNVVSQMIRNPVNGQAFSTRVWNNRDKLANNVNQILRSGITQGVSNDEMAKRLTKFVKSPAGKKSSIEAGYQVSKRLIQTEVTNTYNQATKTGYESTGFVEQYEYVATIDGVTSEICSDLDGQVFNLKDATTGLNYPPMHVNCRSTTVAYFDDSKKLLTRMARDVKTGKNFTVPAKMNHKDFKDIYVNKSITRKEWDQL
jgi:SPP1 gp7 family putative phage head morphogenesis protein